MKQANLMRMVPWLLLALTFYVLALVAVYLSAPPAVQTVLWKYGHLAGGAFLGYWIDRHALGRIDDDSSDGRKIARAILLGAGVIGVALAL